MIWVGKNILNIPSRLLGMKNCIQLSLRRPFSAESLGVCGQHPRRVGCVASAGNPSQPYLAVHRKLKNLLDMSVTNTFVAIFCVILTMSSVATGQNPSVTTPVMGLVTGTCKTNSDTIVSVPLMRPPECVGTISGSATLSGDFATVTASGTVSPVWAPNQFASYYYIKFSSGALNGKVFTIAANDAKTVTFNTEGDTVGGVVDGDQFSVIKYWTIGDLFPPGVQTTFAQSTSRLMPLSSLGIPNTSGTGTGGAGINLSVSRWYLIVGSGTNGKWQDTSAGDASNQILYPDTFFIVRHNPANFPGKAVADTTYAFLGQVNGDRVVTPLLTQAARLQDNFVVLQRPVGVQLSDTGLSGTTGFAQSASRLMPVDTLLVYENNTPGINKSAPYTFCMVNGNWTSLSGSASNNFVIQPGMGFIIRKGAVTGGVTSFWTNNPTF